LRLCYIGFTLKNEATFRTRLAQFVKTETSENSFKGPEKSFKVRLQVAQ